MKRRKKEKDNLGMLRSLLNYPQTHAQFGEDFEGTDEMDSDIMTATVYASPERMFRDEECTMRVVYASPEYYEEVGASTENNTTCENCGRVLDPDFSFCPFCGEKKQEQVNKFCINCGARIKEEYAYCPFCGKRKYMNDDLDFTVKECSGCKSVIPPEARYCPFCGSNAW